MAGPVTATVWRKIGALVFGGLLLAGAPAFAQDEPAPGSQGAPAQAGPTDDDKGDEPGKAGDRSLRDRLVAWVKAHRRQLDGSDKLDGPRRGFFPRGGVVTSGSGLAAGGGYRNERVNGWPIGFDASAMFSLRGYEGYQLMAGLLDRRRGSMSLAPADAKAAGMFREADDAPAGLAVYADLVYRDFPQQPFYGLGPRTRRLDRSDFLLYGVSYDVVAQYQPAPRFQLSARAGLLDLGIGPGRDEEHPNLQDAVAPQLVQQLVQPAKYLALAVGGAFDTRAPRQDPHSGVFAGAAVWRFNGVAAGSSSFTRLTADARTYLMPLDSRGVLALRLLLSADVVPAGGRVPFYLQQSLGGADTLRGFSSYRFRDAALAHATAEYRWLMNDYVDVGPFVDVGVVGPTLGKLRADSVTATFGLRAGLRYRSRVLFHLDWGRSRDGQRVTAGYGVLF